jgi:hypothetical protein
MIGGFHPLHQIFAGFPLAKAGSFGFNLKADDPSGLEALFF